MPPIMIREAIQNKEPLFTTALSLFGSNSWIDLVNRYSDLYARQNVSTDIEKDIYIDFVPLGGILSANTHIPLDNRTQSFEFNDINQCVNPWPPRDPYEILNEVTALNVGRWLYNFHEADQAAVSDGTTAGVAGNETLSNAFAITAYLANLAWINGGYYTDNSLTVSYDPGTDDQKPALSHVGAIVVSILIGLDLSGLLAMALYAFWFPRWTGSLNTFSLLRLGSSIGDRVPFMISVDEDRVRALDDLPGWVGDSAWDDHDRQGEKIGSLALGGLGHLQKWRRS
ncbi:hypothetical protein BDW59DRAFT_176843 [Aspergillus cavernicola]|uniref:Uncharacterized protein n=1 Tax=Aspergillus cavernicola TaxID=176166 RepID=A0ABR4HCF4_9EURO